jgi:hypothetical protein
VVLCIWGLVIYDHLEVFVSYSPVLKIWVNLYKSAHCGIRSADEVMNFRVEFMTVASHYLQREKWLWTSRKNVHTVHSTVMHE